MVPKKTLSPFKLPRKEIIVPDPNDRIVHQRLYEYLRDEKARRDKEQYEASEEHVFEQ